MTWLLIHMKYQYARSMLRLLHDVCTSCTISSYELGIILCLIVTVKMEFYLTEIIARKFIFWHHLFRYSFSFFALLLILHFGLLSVSTHLLRLWYSQICSSFAICRSFLILNLDPHACRYDQNMFFLQLPNL